MRTRDRFLLSVAAAALAGIATPPSTGAQICMSCARSGTFRWWPRLSSVGAADSLYGIARKTLNQGNLSLAIGQFREIPERFPFATSAPAALYWRAYALHRRGLELSANVDLLAAYDVLRLHQDIYGNAPTSKDAADLLAILTPELAKVMDAKELEVAAPRRGSRDGIACAALAGNVQARYAAFYAAASRGTVANTIPGHVEAPYSAVVLQELWMPVDSLAAWPPASAVREIATALTGSGLCSDVGKAADVYGRLATPADAASKEILIAAYGRALHPSATALLVRIARTETDTALRSAAIAWLKARHDPALEETLRPLPPGDY